MQFERLVEPEALAPEQQLNDWFLHIVGEGTDKAFEREHNQRCSRASSLPFATSRHAWCTIQSRFPRPLTTEATAVFAPSAPPVRPCSGTWCRDRARR
jgi:hypothetical protein